MDSSGIFPSAMNVKGAAKMSIQPVGNDQMPLTEEHLFAMHAALFPTGHSGTKKITVGGWRTAASGPPSGPVGVIRLNYKAFPAERIPALMKSFLDWFNADQDTTPMIKAMRASMWLAMIEPFEDGNEEIASAITERVLASSEEGSQQRFDLPDQLAALLPDKIEAELTGFLSGMEAYQKGDLDIAGWLKWFLVIFASARDAAVKSSNRL